MKEYIETRALEIAQYMIETRCTVRHAAKIFKVSKSTVHKDISERLKLINPVLSNQARDILEK